MSAADLVTAAASNTLRSKTRTALTIVAIVIGAFTLALTSAVGTGVNRYIDTTVSSIGASDVLSVTKTPAQAGTGPRQYRADARSVKGPGQGPAAGTVTAMTAADLTTLARIPGVRSVKPALQVRLDYVQHGSGTKYEASLGGFVPGMKVDLAAGAQPDSSATTRQVTLPVSYVKPLGFTSPAAAVGAPIRIASTDADGRSSVTDATIVGVANPGLIAGSSLTANQSLTTTIFTSQSVGLPASVKGSYAQATVRFAGTASPADVTALKQRLVAAGYRGQTVADQIGAFKTIIDAVVLVLNGFALIALLAAGFGIVNTLLTSVQERTREIGLMKAMGMSGRSVFSLFSLEAVFIGLLGSVIGIAAAVGGGLAIDALLSGGLLSALPGLTLIVFDPLSIAEISLAVMAIAFLAGTLPALGAARKDPITALRYE